MSAMTVNPETRASIERDQELVDRIPSSSDGPTPRSRLRTAYRAPVGSGATHARFTARHPTHRGAGTRRRRTRPFPSPFISMLHPAPADES